VPAIESFKSPARLIFSTPSEFFHSAGKTPGIPETSGEIPHAWGNILSSMVHLWPPTITAADTLVSAEKFSAINYALGYAAYPQKEFEFLWKRVLEASDHNNFGQGGDAGDARKIEYANIATVRGGEILRDMLRNIAERVRSPFPRGMPIVVFNPLNWTRDDVVSAHVSLYGDAAPRDIDDYLKGVRLVDETGASIPFYIEQYSGTVSRALEMVFVARGVPSLGYKTYFVVPAEKPEAFPDAAEIKPDADEARPKRVLGADQVENEFYRISIDRATGAVTVFDKELNRVVARDMEITGSEERGGDSLSKEFVTGRTVINTVGSVEMEENNPVRAIVRISGNLAGVPVQQRVFLYRRLKRVDLENTVDWKGEKLIKIEQTFPYEHPGAEIQYGIPFGAVSGSDFMPKSEPRAGDEIGKDFWKEWRQIHDWVFAGTSEWGLTIAADHQVVTLAPGVIRGGMLRGAYSAVPITRHGKPVLRKMPPAGTFCFRYSLSSGKGDWRAGKSYRNGMALNIGLIPVSPSDELSQKTLPPSQSFCSLEGGNLVLSALKKPESGDGLVMRVYETTGSRAETPLLFMGKTERFQEANLLEESRGATDQDTLRIAPFEIKTVRLAIGSGSRP
jgi:alpha-mannosidase